MITSISVRIEDLHAQSQERSARYQGEIMHAADEVKDDLMKRWIIGEALLTKACFMGLLVLQTGTYQLGHKKRRQKRVFADLNESMEAKAEKLRSLETICRGNQITFSADELAKFLDAGDVQLTDQEHGALKGFLFSLRGKMGFRELFPETNYVYRK